MTKDEIIKALRDMARYPTVTLPRDSEALKVAADLLAQPEQCQCPNCKVTLHASDCAVHNEPAYPAEGCDCGAQQGPEFFTHNVEQPYDWSEWVCPDPKGYLMKCCDCGLVHEAEFGVVRYKSETEREDCDRVDDPNLQAVFRMRRSEQWSPKDTAHRAGGLPMEQSEQEPVAWKLVPIKPTEEMLKAMDECSTEGYDERLYAGHAASVYMAAVDVAPTPPQPSVSVEQEPVVWMYQDKSTHEVRFQKHMRGFVDHGATYETPLYTSPPQRTWVGLTDEDDIDWDGTGNLKQLIEAVEAKLKEKNFD